MTFSLWSCPCSDRGPVHDPPGDESARAITTACAAVVFGVPALFVGPPGFSKTEAAPITVALATDGDDVRLSLRAFSPGAPPSVAPEVINLKTLLDNQGIAAATDSTLYDPRLHAFVLNELTRANPATATTWRRRKPASTPVSRRRSRGGSRNIFICLNSALSDKVKGRLADWRRVKVEEQGILSVSYSTPTEIIPIRVVESVARLFEGLPRSAEAFRQGGDIVANLLPHQELADKLAARQSAGSAAGKPTVRPDRR